MKRLHQFVTPLEPFVIRRLWEAYTEAEASSVLCYIPGAGANTFVTRTILRSNPAYGKILPRAPRRHDEPVYDFGLNAKFCTVRLMLYRSPEGLHTDGYLGTYSTLAGLLVATPMAQRFLDRVEEASVWHRATQRGRT